MRESCYKHGNLQIQNTSLRQNNIFSPDDKIDTKIQSWSNRSINRCIDNRYHDQALDNLACKSFRNPVWTWSGTWTKEERSLDFLLIVDDDRDCPLKDLLGIPVPRLPSKRFSSLVEKRKRERKRIFFSVRDISRRRESSSRRVVAILHHV